MDEPNLDVAPGNISVTSDPTAKPRPFKAAFFDELESWRTTASRDYVMGKLMPAAAALLARSIRVRQPTGPLPLLGHPDEGGSPIPDIYGTGNDTNGIDADIVFKVTTERDDGASPFGPVCLSAAAFAYAFFTEAVTGRPIYAVITLCHFDPAAFHRDLETMLHEILHTLAFSSTLYGQFPGYEQPHFDVVLQTDNVSYIQSPQVRAAVRRHFDCPALLGAALEDDLGRGSSGSHWEMRLFRGEVMDSVAVLNPEESGQRAALTDLTLALLQDSNWYDVKYGSAGFNSYGYKAGCAFAMGTFAEAAAAPAARPYLCNTTGPGQPECLWDGGAEAWCGANAEWDGFVALEFVRPYHFECNNHASAAGARCLRTGGSVTCANMTCSAAGAVLVNGLPCDPERQRCPDDGFMCDDPGHLTCVDTLNDCHGRGHCYRGSCFCHLGWGGDDCSVAVCISKCKDGSPCPPSGFCGVPDCGEWSEGSGGRGKPCHAPADFSEPLLATFESEADNPGAAGSPAAAVAPAVATGGFARAPSSVASSKPAEGEADLLPDYGGDGEHLGNTAVGLPVGLPVIGTPGILYPDTPGASPARPLPRAPPNEAGGEGDGAPVRHPGHLDKSGTLCAAHSVLCAVAVAAVSAAAAAAW